MNIESYTLRRKLSRYLLRNESKDTANFKEVKPFYYELSNRPFFYAIVILDFTHPPCTPLTPAFLHNFKQLDRHIPPLSKPENLSLKTIFAPLLKKTFTGQALSTSRYGPRNKKPLVTFHLELTVIKASHIWVCDSQDRPSSRR